MLVKGGAIVRESYFALKQRQQREVNALPIHFAFGRTQIDEKLRELGVKCPEEELVSVGAGGFCLKSDAKSIAETFARHSRERREAMRLYCAVAEKKVGVAKLPKGARRV